MNKSQHFLVALGGNIPSDAGPPAETLRAGLEHLSDQGVVIHAVSRFFKTPCFPAGAGPDYVNAAAKLGYSGDAIDLLEILHATESIFGRTRTERWGRRTLDLDLIAAGDMVLPDAATFDAWHRLPADAQTERAPDQLILPHPRVQDRAFVLVPLAEVAPDWCHPVLKQSVAQLLEALPDHAKSEVVAL